MNPASKIPQDVVFVRNVAIHTIVGLDCWQRVKPQPIILSFRVSSSVKLAGVSDNIDDTMDYRQIYKFMTSLGTQEFLDITGVAETLFGWNELNQHDHALVQCTIQLPKALLHSEGVVLECTMVDQRSVHDDSIINPESVQIFVRDLRISCIIGIGAHERIHKQPVVVNLKLRGLSFRQLQDLAASLGSVYEASPCST
jgi:dihydroneopterin aldolase/2-amino-4-hydroxy-6-hydroxymethyldihydropteridine diphosphokinase/dihydropteroate synthase